LNLNNKVGEQTVPQATKSLSIVRSTPAKKPTALVAMELFPSHTPDLLQSAYRLRYDYFTIKKGWTQQSPLFPFEERDDYDRHAFHLAVIKEAEVVAYMRLLGSNRSADFMLDHDFKPLITQQGIHIVRNNSCEISRLAIKEDCLRPKERLCALQLLFKLFYRISLVNHFEHFYIEVEEEWLRAFGRHFPFQFRQLGNTIIFPDGTPTVLGYSSLQCLEENTRQTSEEHFNWYATD
jgi:N-acyl-L-homoserine lactone synthetase